MKRRDGKQRVNMFETLGSYIGTAFSDLWRLWNHLSDPRKRRHILRNMGSFFRVLYIRITNEGVLKESASLTYITLLGFVPFLTFLFMLAPDLPFLNLKEKFQTVVANNMFPGSAQAIMQFFDEMMARRSVFNVINFVVLVVTSYSLFRVIRNTFDRILSMQLRFGQDLLSQIVKFFGTLLFGLFIIMLLFSSSSLPIISRIVQSQLLRQLNLIVPFVLQFLAVMFLYMLLPSIRVRRASLFRGAFWTTLVWVMAKSLFDIYIYRLTSIQAVYGVIAALPIFLTWIYVNWVIILGGIVLVSVLENRDFDVEKAYEPQKTVRLTIEMYSNGRLNERFEKLMGKKDLKQLIENIEEDLEQ